MIEIPFWLFITLLFMASPFVFAIIGLITIGLTFLVTNIAEKVITKGMEKEKKE